MGGNSGWDAIVFGEVVFPEGGIMVWAQEVFHRLGQLEAFNEGTTEELAQVLITPVGVAIRAWFFSSSFQEWCPRIEAMFSTAARLGGRGDVTFVGIGDGPAYKLICEGGRATLARIPTLGFEDPTVQEIALAVESKAERWKVAALSEAASSESSMQAALAQRLR